MHARRLPLRWLSGWLIAAILFSQLAVAAYVCPQARAAADPGMAAMAGMPCAAMMGAASALDQEQPGLCLQHCQFGSTSAQPADHAAVVVAFVALLLFMLIPTAARRAGGLVWLTRARRCDRAPPPPHSILHCCHRI